MGTTLVNLHIFDGDEQQLRSLLPNAVVGRWSDRFVSIYFEDFEPKLNDKIIKTLSKNIKQPILRAWIFDSDAVGFDVYKDGKCIVEHNMDPDGNNGHNRNNGNNGHNGFNKMGSISIFCENLMLPAEDERRLRAVWKKGSAEEQMGLTALLLGLPLNYNSKVLPDRMHFRDVKIVDQWIAERPALPRIKNETKATLAQELPKFRWNYPYDGELYCSVEPYDDEYDYDVAQFWITGADGLLQPGCSADGNLALRSSQGRILGLNIPNGTVDFDSAKLLPVGYKAEGTAFFMPDGGLLWWLGPNGYSRDKTTLTRCSRDGSVLWRKDGDFSGTGFFSCLDDEIILTPVTDVIRCGTHWGTHWLERVDGMTGETIEKLPRPFGLGTWSKAFNAGQWWITHDGLSSLDEKRVKQLALLTKLDAKLQPLAEIPLPKYTQAIFFSPDNSLVYVFFTKEQVMVLNAESLAVENVLNDKTYLMPRKFDIAGRFFLQRGGSTIEAWDAMLKKPLSRHKLKGEIMGSHINDQGIICVVTWSSDEKKLRVYKVQ